MSELSEPVTTGCRGAPGAVIGTPDEKWGELVAALIVASDPALTEEGLIAHCRKRVAGYKCPKRIVLVSSLASTATGKLPVMVSPHRLPTPGRRSRYGPRDRSG